MHRNVKFSAKMLRLPGEWCRMKRKEAMGMTDILKGVRSPLFDGISEQERGAMLGCIG